MKITKKIPLRPRGRSEEKRQATKDAIRYAYANGPPKEVQIIPAKRDLEPEAEKKKLRVCAYCRVSTDEDTQASSYELQVQNYTKMIRENPEWEFAGIFADEGISGTSVLHRAHFLASRMRFIMSFYPIFAGRSVLSLALGIRLFLAFVDAFSLMKQHPFSISENF